MRFGNKIIALALISALAMPAKASDPETQANTGLTLATKYLNARGFTPHDKPVLEPHAGLNVDFGNMGSLSLNYWGAFGINGEGTVENDLTGTYSHDVGPINSAVSWARYDVQGGLFEEINVAVSADIPTKPKLFIAYDYADGSGLYVEPSLGHNAGPLDMRVALLLNNDYAVDFQGIAGIRADVSVSFPIGHNFSLTPNFRYFQTFADTFDSDWSVALTLDYVLKKESTEK